MSPQLLRGAGSYFFEGSPVGCLLVHGMGSTPSQHKGLPPNITAFLHGWYPPNEL